MYVVCRYQLIGLPILIVFSRLRIRKKKELLVKISHFPFVYFTFNIPDDEHVFPSFPSFHVEEGGQTLKE